MRRTLAVLICFGAAVLGAPSRSEAGVIPWMYDAIFGYGHAGYGGGYGWGSPYYGGSYVTGYAPMTRAAYRRAYRLSSWSDYSYPSYSVGYAPWYGYSGGMDCCSPCGGSCSPCGAACGSPCGGCDTGCGSCGGGNCAGGNCPGGNCGTPASTSTVPSTPSTPGTGATPTYAPPATDPTKQPPADQFGPANRTREPAGGSGNVPAGGTSIPGATGSGGFGGFGTNPGAADPNSPAPAFGPGEPGGVRPDAGGRDLGTSPTFAPGDKVAFRIPARFQRTNVQKEFELPTIVSAPPRQVPEPAPTVVAAK